MLYRFIMFISIASITQAAGPDAPVPKFSLRASVNMNISEAQNDHKRIKNLIDTITVAHFEEDLIELTRNELQEILFNKESNIEFFKKHLHKTQCATGESEKYSSKKYALRRLAKTAKPFFK